MHQVQLESHLEKVEVTHRLNQVLQEMVAQGVKSRILIAAILNELRL